LPRRAPAGLWPAWQLPLHARLPWLPEPGSAPRFRLPQAWPADRWPRCGAFQPRLVPRASASSPSGGMPKRYVGHLRSWRHSSRARLIQEGWGPGRHPGTYRIWSGLVPAS